MLHPKVLDLRARAKELGWGIKVSDFPYKPEEVERCEQEVSTSEALHPKVLELREQARELGWRDNITVFPYSASAMVQAEEQLKELHPKALDLERRAKALGWDLDVGGFPYSVEEVKSYEEQLLKSEQLRPQALKLEAKYGVQFSVPYDEKEVLRFVTLSESLASVLIPAGTFQMGCPVTDDKFVNYNDLELPVHEVQLTHAFYMMKSEVTQGMWKAVKVGNPSSFKSCGDDCPVDKVSWNDVIKYSNLLNEKLGLEPCYEVGRKEVSWSKGYDCKGWRLPTEAEWEYAARGGTGRRFFDSTELISQGWYTGNSEDTTHPVCEKQKNGYGLCDMSGNVFEWVWDRYGEYPSSKQVDPVGPETGVKRVNRGGSWYTGSRTLKPYAQSSNDAPSRYSYLGFRLVRTSD